MRGYTIQLIVFQRELNIYDGSKVSSILNRLDTQVNRIRVHKSTEHEFGASFELLTGATRHASRFFEDSFIYSFYNHFSFNRELAVKRAFCIL